MQVSYENNLDDLIALNIDLMKNNVQFKKRKFWSLYGTPVFLLFAFSFFAYITNQPNFYGGAIGGALFSYLWAFFGYKNYPKKAAKQLHQKEILCEHNILVTAEGIKESTVNSKTYHQWDAINHVSFNDDYVFIYNTPMTAHVIPKRVIGESDFIQIKEKITAYQSPNTSK